MSAQMSMSAPLPTCSCTLRSIAACTSRATHAAEGLAAEPTLQDRNLHAESFVLTVHLCARKRRKKIELGPGFCQIMGAVRALPSKFSRRSGPCQIMALREQPVKFYGPPGPLLSPPACDYTFYDTVLVHPTRDTRQTPDPADTGNTPTPEHTPITPPTMPTPTTPPPIRQGCQ